MFPPCLGKKPSGGNWRRKVQTPAKQASWSLPGNLVLSSASMTSSRKTVVSQRFDPCILWQYFAYLCYSFFFLVPGFELV